MSDLAWFEDLLGLEEPMPVRTRTAHCPKCGRFAKSGITMRDLEGDYYGWVTCKIHGRVLWE